MSFDLKMIVLSDEKRIYYQDYSELLGTVYIFTLAELVLVHTITRYSLQSVVLRDC